jgi:hypothetical protein
VVWAIVLPIASKLWVKLRFMRDLKPRTPPQASIDTNGQQLKTEGQEQVMQRDGQSGLASVPSVVPEYDRTTLHTSVAPPVEPFAAGLAALLPPAEQRHPVPGDQRLPVSEPPPSSRGPMVIRVEVPSFSAASASINPLLESTLPTSDGQLSAIARTLGGGAMSEPPRTLSERPQ